MYLVINSRFGSRLLAAPHMYLIINSRFGSRRLLAAPLPRSQPACKLNTYHAGSKKPNFGSVQMLVTCMLCAHAPHVTTSNLCLRSHSSVSLNLSYRLNPDPFSNASNEYGCALRALMMPISLSILLPYHLSASSRFTGIFQYPKHTLKYCNCKS